MEGMEAADPHAQINQKGLTPLARPVSGAVITVSTRCAQGLREDQSGPLAVELLRQWNVICPPAFVIPDGAENVTEAISAALAGGARVVLTTGGTGVTPSDKTPEGTEGLLAAHLPGIEVQILLRGLENTPLAGLSRGLVGVTETGPGGALVVNAPGSRGGVKDTIAVVGPLIPHVLEQLDNAD